MTKTILGALSIALGVVSFFIFWWLAIVGFCLGAIGLCVKQDDSDPEKRDFGRAGTICSIIGMVICGVALIVLIISLITVVVAR